MSRIDTQSRAGGFDFQASKSLSGSSKWAKQRLAYEQMRPMLDLLPGKLAQIKERRLARLNGANNWIRKGIDEDLLAMLLAARSSAGSVDD